MKTKMIILAAMLAAAFSCQKAVLSEGVVTEPAIITTEVETKTTLSGNEVHWTAGDAVLVYDNLGGKNTFTTTGTGKTAEFRGDVTAGTEQIYAVYPAALAGEAINGSILSVTIPAEQTPAEGTFAEDLNITVAKAVKTPGDPQISGVTFKNVCSLLKFTIPAYVGDAQSVTISSSSILAGSMTIDYSGEEPVAAVSSEGKKSISMRGSFNAGSTFCFVVAPNTIEDLTVTVVTDKGTYSKTAKPEGGITLTAGKYKNLGILDLNKVTIASATAAHTYENNILTGTKVTVYLGLLDYDVENVTGIDLQIVTETVQEGSLLDKLGGLITGGDGSTTVVNNLLTYSTSNTVKAGEEITIQTNDNFPYLPKGEYKIQGSYYVNGVKQTLNDVTFQVPAPFNTENNEPAFSATYNVYTSYTRYAAGDISGANALDGNAIYMDFQNANISSKILNKLGNNVVEYVLNLEGGNTLAGNGGTITVDHTGFGAYTINTITSTFDGSKPCTSEAEAGTYHITGIPYNYDFDGKQQEAITKAGWRINGSPYYGYSLNLGLIKFDLGSLILHMNIKFFSRSYSCEGSVVSPKFHVPTDLKIQPTIHQVSFDKSYTTCVGPVAEGATKNENTEYSYNTTSQTITAINSPIAYNTTKNFSLTTSAPFICIDCSSESNNSVAAFYDVFFKYAE